MTFYIGQKVVCVRVFFEGNQELGWARARALGVVLPDEGAVYTVTGLQLEWGQPTLFLAEINNRHLVARHPYYYSEEPGFPRVWFRPLVERKTDISIFKAMLTPATEELFV